MDNFKESISEALSELVNVPSSISMAAIVGDRSETMPKRVAAAMLALVSQEREQSMTISAARLVQDFDEISIEAINYETSDIGTQIKRLIFIDDDAVRNDFQSPSVINSVRLAAQIILVARGVIPSLNDAADHILENLTGRSGIAWVGWTRKQIKQSE